jgi:hypothetical protein
LKLLKLVLPSGVGNTPKIAIFRMCYGENGTVKFLETLADNVCIHNYSIMQIKKVLHPYMCLCDHIDNYCTRKENYLEPSIVKVRFNQ